MEAIVQPLVTLAESSAPAPVRLPATAAPLLDAERLQALQVMPFRDYLRSPEWIVARDEAITRAGGHCALGADHVEGLDALHRNYERLGTERHADLIVLCADCRARHQARYGGPSRRPHIRPRPFDEARA